LKAEDTGIIISSYDLRDGCTLTLYSINFLLIHWYCLFGNIRTVRFLITESSLFCYIARYIVNTLLVLFHAILADLNGKVMWGDLGRKCYISDLIDFPARFLKRNENLAERQLTSVLYSQWNS